MELKANEVDELSLDIERAYFNQTHIDKQIIPFTESDYKNFNQDKDDIYKLFEGGIVYFIHMKETNYYKIGISSNYRTFQNRIETFKTGVPFDVEIITFITLEKGISESSSFIEKFLHDYFKGFNKNREWFEFNRNQVLAIYCFLNYSLDIWDCYVNQEIELELSPK